MSISTRVSPDFWNKEIKSPTFVIWSSEEVPEEERRKEMMQEADRLFQCFELEKRQFTVSFLEKLNDYFDVFRGTVSIYWWNEETDLQQSELSFNNQTRCYTPEDVQHRLVGQKKEDIH